MLGPNTKCPTANKVPAIATYRSLEPIRYDLTARIPPMVLANPRPRITARLSGRVDFHHSEIVRAAECLSIREALTRPLKKMASKRATETEAVVLIRGRRAGFE